MAVIQDKLDIIIANQERILNSLNSLQNNHRVTSDIGTWGDTIFATNWNNNPQYGLSGSVTHIECKCHNCTKNRDK